MISLGFFLLGIIIMICFIYRDCNWPGFGEWMFALFIGSMVGIAITLAASGIIGGIVVNEYVLKDTFPIYALQDNNGVQGSFFLGSGSVDSNLKYYYAAQCEDGIKIYNIDTEKAILKNDENPHIETYKAQFVNKFLRNNLANLCDDKYKIYIPQGSIQYNFNVDLK
jgi:hypothetical protein